MYDLEAAREELVSYSARLLDDGLAVGSAGNLSVRLGDLIAITPSGISYREMRPADIAVIGLDGTELAIAALGGPVRVAPSVRFGSAGLASAAARALDGRRAASLRNHGAITYGRTLAAADRAPFSQSLIADDARTFLASAELLGGPTVPSVGIATCFTGDSTWHTRQGSALGGITFWADLEPRAAGTGALRLIPGSHLPDFASRICEYRGAEPATSGFEHWEWPHLVIETEPGDVVAFHVHLMNCARGGLPRLSWTIDYLQWPGIADRERMEMVRDFVNDDVEFDHEDYDRDRWPVWREWAAGADPTLSRAIAVERLTLFGVLTNDS